MGLKSVLLLAAENAALKGAKVGGMADVIGDLPAALEQVDIAASVLMPGYGFLASRHGAALVAEFTVPFRDGHWSMRLSILPHPKAQSARIYLIDGPSLDAAPSALYHQSSPLRPFADDADRFALFGAAAATALCNGLVPMPDVLHLHDWHLGAFALLRAFDPRYLALRDTPAVLTVHNLALQGTRPLAQESSSLAAWFPALFASLDGAQLALLADRRYGGCINPLRAAINLVDRVHLVSPHYCEEVLLPSRPEAGFIGGESLELDLARHRDRGTLVGILNGCNYDNDGAEGQSGRPTTSELVRTIKRTLIRVQAHRREVAAVDFIAAARLPELFDNEQAFVISSVGRLTAQKVQILRQRRGSGETVLEALLAQLRDWRPDARLIMLGSGDEGIGREFQAIAALQDNFLFINHYDEALSEALYLRGDLFLMPSSFEPCGISQMLAMRAGQPCLVHAVGGLVDTVSHGHNGWSFQGETPLAQGEALLARLAELLPLVGSDTWRRVAANAVASRFDWPAQARQYANKLYS
ncbi:glycogen synthase [Shewanella cyperi]|uniref:glycogen synthase n=1 Tax=Shewanella cyperi TaxID=2814292 RepID=UPI001D184633|nr:glycogen/starch synthase [Shewanella cyperi]